MSLYPRGSLSGKYPVASPADIAIADYGIGHEFGTPHPDGDPGAVNRALAAYIAEHCRALPMYVAQSVADALHEIDPSFRVAGIFNGTSSNTVASRGGTRSELLAVRSLAGTSGRVLHIAQAYHAGRVAEQSRRLGFQPLLPPNLPRLFDPRSGQWWCRRRTTFLMREVIGIPVLKLKQQF